MSKQYYITIASVTIVSIIILIGFFLFFKSEPKQNTQTGEPNLSSEIEKSPTLVNLTSQELAVMLEKKDFFFANVHIPYEGEIKNTDASISYDKVADNLDKLPKDKNAKIVLYCMSGRMSKIAGDELIQLGYTDVSHLSGGMIAWERSSYEIIKN